MNDNIIKGDSVNETVYNLLEGTNTNWLVEKQPLVSIKGLETKSFGTFRSDTGQWLGTMKESYVPLQNKEMAQTIVEASCDFGEKFRGGILKKGRKIFYQIQLPDYKVANDTIKRWLTMVNSHDGSTSIGFGSTNTVVICQNTFYKAYKDIEKFRHTVSAKERIEIAKVQLMNTLQSDLSLMNSYEKMTQHEITVPLFENIMKKLFKVESLDITSKDVSTQKKNQIVEFNNVYTKEITSHGDSLWGLFNAVTYFENHVRVKPEKQLDHIFIGGNSNKMLLTYNEIMSFIESTEKPKKVLVKR